MAEATNAYDPASTDPWSVPLDAIDVSDPALFETNTHWGYFDRLRKEDPVHFANSPLFGPYWSITKFNDIIQAT